MKVFIQIYKADVYQLSIMYPTGYTDIEDVMLALEDLGADFMVEDIQLLRDEVLEYDIPHPDTTMFKASAVAYVVRAKNATFAHRRVDSHLRTTAICKSKSPYFCN